MEAEQISNLHAGHRQRMQETFLRSGIDAFSDVQVLEFLLGYAIPRRDVNPLAHRLLEEFGSLCRVFDAPVDRLLRVPGVGPRAAALIRLCGAAWGRTERARVPTKLNLNSVEEIGRYLSTLSAGLREERAWLICLDAKCCLLDCRELGRGAVNAVNIPIRKLVQAALDANASTVILAHNHPYGTLLPSPEDVEYTNLATQMLRAVDVTLFDHIILCDREFLSMRKSGLPGLSYS